MSNKLHRSGWSYLGEGLAWFLIWIGFGGCVLLTHHSSKDGPLISITTSK
jgi:hypothetical protein